MKGTNNMNEIQRIYRRMCWLLLTINVLFVGFGILTIRVEGGVMGYALVAVGITCGITALWLRLSSRPGRPGGNPYNKRWLAVVPVTLAILFGGIIGTHTTTTDRPAEAHWIVCTRPSVGHYWWSEWMWNAYYGCLAQQMLHWNWHIINNVAGAFDRSGPL